MFVFLSYRKNFVGNQNEFELATVNEPSVFELLKFDCISTVLSTAHGKTFFDWRFILNGIIDFGLTISYQEPFVFTVSMLCFQIFIVKLIL